MALNKVNIEFLTKQMDKVLVDIEKLKDANRDGMKYTNGSYSTMIEAVVALLMFWDGEIKEASYAKVDGCVFTRTSYSGKRVQS